PLTPVTSPPCLTRPSHTSLTCQPHTPYPASSFLISLPLPPTSTLFPTRRSSDLVEQKHRFALVRFDHGVSSRCRKKLAAGSRSRSEEHTSELQSLRHLVCRLLLEKKKEMDACEYIKIIVLIKIFLFVIDLYSQRT